MQNYKHCFYSQSKRSDCLESEMKTEYKSDNTSARMVVQTEVKTDKEKTFEKYVVPTQFSKLKGVLPGKNNTERPNLSLLENEDQTSHRTEEEDQSTKYTLKSCTSFLLICLTILCILCFYLYYSVFTNFFYWTINTACSQTGYIVKFPCSQRLRTLFSYKKFAENTEKTIKSLSSCFKAKIFKTPLSLLSTKIRDCFFSCIFFYAIYFLLYNFVDDASYAFFSCFITALISSSL